MKIIQCIAILLITLTTCRAQQLVKYADLRYVSSSYHSTLNESFANKRLVFQNGTDSLIMNIKVPYDKRISTIYEPGIFYDCKLKPGVNYSFELKPVTAGVIPKNYNSYYLTNCSFVSGDKFIFKEYKKNTPYKYEGINGIFVDINHKLFLIGKMTPATDCTFPL